MILAPPINHCCFLSTSCIIIGFLFFSIWPPVNPNTPHPIAAAPPTLKPAIRPIGPPTQVPIKAPANG